MADDKTILTFNTVFTDSANTWYDIENLHDITLLNKSYTDKEIKTLTTIVFYVKWANAQGKTLTKSFAFGNVGKSGNQQNLSGFETYYWQPGGQALRYQFRYSSNKWQWKCTRRG